MKITSLLLTITLAITSLSQNSNDKLFKQAINKLNEGNTAESHLLFNKLSELEDSNSLYRGYVSYTFTKKSLFEDTIDTKTLAEAKKLANIAYRADSNDFINKFAYTNTLYLTSKHTTSKKEIARLLTEIKTKLDELTNDKDVNADAYNLLAIWNRVVSNYDQFELEMMKTFYKNAPIGGTFENAIKMHKKAFELNERTEYKYELALTYKSIDIEDLYMNTLNEGAAIHGESSDDLFFQAKCENNLPKLGY